jgi:hypothetical protein
MSKAKFVAGARIESHQHMVERVNRNIQAVQLEIRDKQIIDADPLFAKLYMLEQQREKLIFG